MTQQEADRSYRVLMHALLEEKRLKLITKEEFDKRHREIFKDCYGEVEIEASRRDSADVEPADRPRFEDIVKLDPYI